MNSTGCFRGLDIRNFMRQANPIILPTSYCTALWALLSFECATASDDYYDFSRLDSTSCNDLAGQIEDAKNKEKIDAYVSNINTASVLRYVANDDSWIGEVYSQLEVRRFLVKPIYGDEIKKLKEKVSTDDQLEYIRKNRRSIKIDDSEGARPKKGEANYSYYKNSFNCMVKSLLAGEESNQLKKIRSVVDTATNVTKNAVIGYFYIKVNSCEIMSNQITGNSYTEPKSWPGSRFVVIDASFKNLDQEGRLPSEGSLIIKHNGRELKYDSTETIMQEGYGIYFKSVNPLITMPTKIVYRIPNEVSGEVSWEPGRNLDGKRLWCTFASPEK